MSDCPILFQRVSRLIKLKEAVIVEGKYDKINIENFIDAFIVVANGFGIFKDKENTALLRKIAKENGLIVMTDSDSAGMLIRSHLKGIIGEGEVIHVYLPQISGKEKRKEKHSAEGFLGVEGLSEEIIITALENAGVVGQKVNKRSEISINKAVLFELGLSGTADSKANRQRLLKGLGLPLNMSANALIDYMGRIYSEEEFKRVCAKWLNQKDSN